MYGRRELSASGSKVSGMKLTISFHLAKGTPYSFENGFFLRPQFHDRAFIEIEPRDRRRDPLAHGFSCFDEVPNMPDNQAVCEVLRRPSPRSSNESNFSVAIGFALLRIEKRREHYPQFAIERLRASKKKCQRFPGFPLFLGIWPEILFSQKLFGVSVDEAAQIRPTQRPLVFRIVLHFVEAPDDASAITLAMSVGKLGFIRTQTLRAYSAAEIAPIMDNVV